MYFFERPELADKYVEHLYSKSMCESFTKFSSIYYNANVSSSYYWDEEPEQNRDKDTESPFTVYLDKRLVI